MDLYSKYFVPFPTVRSGNVILRRMRKDDLPGLYDYCRRDESCRYSEWSPHRKPSDTAGFISWIISGYRRHESFTFAVTTAEGDVIGTASYMKFDENYRVAEIGYGINSDYWHKGYGKSVVEGLIYYAFEVIGVLRVCARVLPENEASAALLKGRGFTLEGVNRRALCFKGAYRDVAVYSMLRDEYISCRTRK